MTPKRNFSPPEAEIAARLHYGHSALPLPAEPAAFWNALVTQLARLHACTPMSIGHNVIPVHIIHSHTSHSLRPSEIDLQLDSSNPSLFPEVGAEREFLDNRLPHPVDSDPYNNPNIRILSIEPTTHGNFPRLICGNTDYYKTYSEGLILERELFSKFHHRQNGDVQLDQLSLPLREAVSRGRGVILNGRDRIASLSVSTCMIIKHPDEGYGCLVRRRAGSANMATAPNTYHVVPSGMVEPLLVDPREFVEIGLFKEKLEEVFNVDTMRCDLLRRAPSFVMDEEVIAYVLDLIERKRAALAVTGLILDLFNLCYEITTVLVIDDTEYFSKFSPEMHISKEYLEPGGEEDSQMGLTKSYLWPLDRARQELGTSFRPWSWSQAGAASLKLGLDWFDHHPRREVHKPNTPLRPLSTTVPPYRLVRDQHGQYFILDANNKFSKSLHPASKYGEFLHALLSGAEKDLECGNALGGLTFEQVDDFLESNLSDPLPKESDRRRKRSEPLLLRQRVHRYINYCRRHLKSRGVIPDGLIIYERSSRKFRPNFSKASELHGECGWWCDKKALNVGRDVFDGGGTLSSREDIPDPKSGPLPDKPDRHEPAD